MTDEQLVELQRKNRLMDQDAAEAQVADAYARGVKDAVTKSFAMCCMTHNTSLGKLIKQELEALIPKSATYEIVKDLTKKDVL